MSREEIVNHIWGPDLFVEAEAGINTAIRKIRRVLQDIPKRPAYIETVPGRGYRFALPAGEPTASSQVRLAVVPVVSLDQSPERQYLADGLTEEVIAALGQVDPDHLSVIGRTSMMTYQGTSKSLSEIGQALGAEFLVESSMRADGEFVRITPRLVRAIDQTQLWCDSFDGERGSSGFQRELSVAITQQVQSRLSSDRLNTIARRHPRQAEAYDLYLQGRYYWHQLSAETTRHAIEYYRRAVALAPDYGLAWAGIGVAYAASPITGDVPANIVVEAARNAASQAIRSAPDLAESHTSDGFVKFWLDWDLSAGEAAFRMAIALDPSDALAHRTLGIVLAYQQRAEEAAASAGRACELDPLNAAHYALSAQVSFFGREFGSAMTLAKQAISIDSTFWIGHLQQAQVAQQTADCETALEALNHAGTFSGNNSKVLALRGYLLATMGRADEARQVLTTMEAVASHRYLPPYAPALVFLGLNDFEQTFFHLERALEAHDVHLNFLLVDPKWDPLRADRRFQSVILRCGFRT